MFIDTELWISSGSIRAAHNIQSRWCLCGVLKEGIESSASLIKVHVCSTEWCYSLWLLLWREKSHHIDYCIIRADWKTLNTLTRQAVISSKLYKTCLTNISLSLYWSNNKQCTENGAVFMRMHQFKGVSSYFVAVAYLAKKNSVENTYTKVKATYFLYLTVGKWLSKYCLYLKVW